MGKIKTYSMISLVTAVFVLSSAIQAAPRSTPVTVVNDEANPVPVTGTVDTNVLGTPGVTIENGPQAPVPVTNVGQLKLTDIVQLSAFGPRSTSGGSDCIGSGIPFSNLTRNGGVLVPFNIPDNRALVVNSINYVVQDATAGERFDVSIKRFGSNIFINDAFRTSILVDSTGSGAKTVNVSPGVVTTAELCLVVSGFPTGRVTVWLYGYLQDI